MTKRPIRSRGKPVPMPILGKAQHNAAIQMLIGGLVINWANNESLFLAVLQCLVGGSRHTASIIWFSQRTSVARLDLVWRLARERITDAAVLADLEKAIDRFKSLTRWRNFYCHATYVYDEELNLHGAQGVTLTQEGAPVRGENKAFNRATINEINQATLDLADFNGATWKLVHRIEDALGVQRVTPPPQPGVPQGQ